MGLNVNLTEGDNSEQHFSGDRELFDGEIEPDIRTGMYSPEEDALKRTSSDLEQGMIDAVAFFYNAAKDAGLDPQDLIEKAVKRAEDRTNDGSWIINDVSINVEKNREMALAREALASISSGEELSDAELRALLQSDLGKITPDEIQGYIAGEWEPPEEESLDPTTGV